MAELLSSKQLSALRERLRRHGYRRFPRLRSEIEDLTAQAVADLWTYLKNRSHVPALDEEAILRIAYTIFNRRAADMYRKTTPEFTPGEEQGAASEQADHAASDPMMTGLYRKILGVCQAELKELSQEDQMALAVAIGLASGQGEAMTPAERQRLHRLRKRLATAIQHALGEDAYKLLRESTWG